MSTLGMTNIPIIVVGDTDGLIAILHSEDINHKKAIKTVTRLISLNAQIIFSVTTIAETITTLIRKLNKPNLAAMVVERITNGELAIENTDTDMLNQALKVFNAKGSKKNTIFDALVVATAKKLDTNVIFSTDEWYSKLGFTLAIDLA